MSNKKIIYFDKVYDEFKQVLYENKPEGFDLQFWAEMDKAEQENSLERANYLLVATEKIGGEILSHAKQVKFIQKTGIGVDNIDLEAANKFNLPVANTPGANSTGVAELTILYILALYRKLPLLNKETKSGKWLMWELRPSSFEMEGKTHGFIGFGNIGREAARRSRAFGTNIIYYDQFQAPTEIERELDAAYLPLEEVLKSSDIVSLHIPYLPETKGLIGARELQMMKPNAVLINVSRGGIVEEKALSEALTNEVIAGAGVDVWESEPVDRDNPLLKLENVIASPHIGAGTRDTLKRVLKMAFNNIEKVESGKGPDYVVNDVKETRVIK